jgi:hypothetical protein
MNDRLLDDLEFQLNVTRPEGCICTHEPTETLGLLQFVWNPECPKHRVD